MGQAQLDPAIVSHGEPMSEDWAKWEKQVVGGTFPLRRSLRSSAHSAVFLTEHSARIPSDALLKLVPAIPTLKEAQMSQWSAAAGLSHPYLVQLLETGRCQLGGLQFLFVVMEYAERTLAEVLSQRALAADELRRVLRPVLGALSFLHRRNLVQGGLTPSSVLIVNKRPKLASDTIRPAGESSASLASASVYDPPESRDGSYTTAGDIWCLGVIMVEALTRQQPTWREPGGTVVLPAGLPPAFAVMIRRCLNRDPAKRPTVNEIAADINPAPIAVPTLAAVPESPIPDVEPDSERVARLERQLAIPALSSYRPRLLFPVAVVVGALTIAAWRMPEFSAGRGGAQAVVVPAVAVVNEVLPSSESSDEVQRSLSAAASAPAPEDVPVAASAPAHASMPSSASAPAPGPQLRQPEPVVAVVPSVIHEELPDVPQRAMETIRGRLLFAVRVTISNSGTVVHATAERTRSSRYLARLATEAATKWRFPPTEDHGSRRRLLRFEFTRQGVTAHAI